MFPPGSAKTLVRTGGITKWPLDSILPYQHLSQKLLKFVNVYRRYSAQRQCRFLRHSVHQLSHGCLMLYNTFNFKVIRWLQTLQMRFHVLYLYLYLRTV